MRGNVKSGTLAWLLGLFLVIVAGCEGTNDGTTDGTTDPDTTFSIGMIAPFSGAAVGLGQDAEQCVDFAIKEINQAGGVLGKPLELQSFDSRSDSENALAGLEQLHADGISAVIGPLLSESVLTSQQFAHENDLLLISPTATSPEISDLGDFVWRTSPSDALQGGVAAQTVAVEGQWESAAVIHLNNSYGQGLASLFKEEFEALGGDLVAVGSYPELGPDELEAYDFEPVLNTLLEDEPQVLFMASYSLDGATITWRLAAQLEGDYRPQLVGSEFGNQPEFLANANREVAQNMVVVSPTVPKESENYKLFETGFAQYLGTAEEEVQPWCSMVYDAVYLVAYATEGGGGTDGKTIVENLPAVSEVGEVINVGEWQQGVSALATTDIDIDYQGASGSLRFDANGDIIEAFYEVQIIFPFGIASLPWVVKYEYDPEK